MGTRLGRPISPQTPGWSLIRSMRSLREQTPAHSDCGTHRSNRASQEHKRHFVLHDGKDRDREPKKENSRPITPKGFAKLADDRRLSSHRIVVVRVSVTTDRSSLSVSFRSMIHGVRKAVRIIDFSIGFTNINGLKCRYGAGSINID